MRTSNYRKKLDKKVWKIIWGTIGGCVLAGMIFFFAYFNVTHVEVVESTHYSKDEIQDMVLTGPLASNSVLAPLLYSKDNVEDIPFVEKFEVTRINHNTIAVSVKEMEAVGCIPYLDCYIYFDREGIMIDSSVERDKVIPYFDGIHVNYVVKGQKLPIEGDTVLNTAVSLARIFEKNESIPDNISFDDNYQITLQYGDIRVELGQDQYLEDKMEKVIAILPLLDGKKGTLHLENVSDSMQKVTFEEDVEEETDQGEDDLTEADTSTDEEVMMTEATTMEVMMTEATTMEVMMTEVTATEVMMMEVMMTGATTTEVMMMGVTTTEVMMTGVTTTEVMMTEATTTEVMMTEAMTANMIISLWHS